MPAPLATPYADTRADALSFVLGLEPLDALAVLPLERGGVSVQLRLLGASHQVIAGPISETVACLPAIPGPLPDTVHHDLDGWTYDFTADVLTYPDDATFAAAVEQVCADLDGRDDALTGVFPGSPHAVTALAWDDRRPCAAPADARTLGWRTWHSYPQTKEIVTTRTRLEVHQ